MKKNNIKTFLKKQETYPLRVNYDILNKQTKSKKKKTLNRISTFIIYFFCLLTSQNLFFAEQINGLVSI